jgi:hypothetical protein
MPALTLRPVVEVGGPAEGFYLIEKSPTRARSGDDDSDLMGPVSLNQPLFLALTGDADNSRWV